MKVVKRDGRIINFDINRIVNAINSAMMETKDGIDTNLSVNIAKQVENEIINKQTISVEEIQDMVENKLMNSNRKDVAKQYIVYRNERNKYRKPSNTDRLLSDEFISKYKHMSTPMNQLGTFVYYRTYSRWIPEEKRREFWWETVRRAVEYNCSLSPTTKEEAEVLYDNIFNLKSFLSGRTFWVGGTPVAYKYPMSNFNCAFSIIDNLEAFKDLFYLLMVGTGFGIRILPEDVEQLPKIRADIEIIHKDYIPIAKKEREDNTSIEFINDVVKITIGDSKEGWTQALDYYFKVLSDKDYRKINTIIIDYDNVRRKGERLNTFGGTASGHESLKSMFEKIDKVIKDAGAKYKSHKIKLKPINCLDIANIIGENVVVGGVRRTAENSLIDEDDILTIRLKAIFIN
jgi:ribonucleoside-diphosphate reductase alpha chain/ribonucleoside-triphosphate reductase